MPIQKMENCGIYGMIVIQLTPDFGISSRPTNGNSLNLKTRFDNVKSGHFFERPAHECERAEISIIPPRQLFVK